MSLQQIANSTNRGLETASNMKVGKTTLHPDGRRVKITNGQFLSKGKASNFWHWREVKKNGKLGKEETGYGW